MPEDNGWDAIPDAGRTGAYVEARKAQLKAQGRLFDPAEYRGPRLSQLMTQARNEELAERERLAAEARAQLSPRQLWLSTLSAQERARIATWEKVNKLPFPVPGLE